MPINPHARCTFAAAAFIMLAAGLDAVAQTSPISAVRAPAETSDQTAIRGVMAAYIAALNAGDTARVMPLYTEDGIFMPPYSQSAVGKDAIRNAYDGVFKELKFSVRLDIAELVVMAPGWAYIRTNSAGTTAHASTGTTTAEANQELFIVKKGNDGKWRIARYSFSPTKPPQA